MGFDVGWMLDVGGNGGEGCIGFLFLFSLSLVRLDLLYQWVCILI